LLPAFSGFFSHSSPTPQAFCPPFLDRIRFINTGNGSLAIAQSAATVSFMIFGGSSAIADINRFAGGNFMLMMMEIVSICGWTNRNEPRKKG
jgi:hypothetical protein